MPKNFINDVRDPTLCFYENNAQHYSNVTVSVDMTPIYARFEKYLRKGARILDAGSGSGRDTKHFLTAGFQVFAFDYSDELAKISTAYTGIPTAVKSFSNFDEVEQYDGIWACASLLHTPITELPPIIEKLAIGLRPSGILYISFRYGEGEHKHSDGRFYSDLNETTAHNLFAAIPSLKIHEIWVSSGEGCFEGEGLWLNVILKKMEHEENVS